jgi:hypothetical protein
MRNTARQAPTSFRFLNSLLDGLQYSTCREDWNAAGFEIGVLKNEANIQAHAATNQEAIRQFGVRVAHLALAVGGKDVDGCLEALTLLRETLRRAISPASTVAMR